MNRLAATALLAASLHLPAAAAAGVAESWYLARGRANMDIGNYAAAVEAYRKALDANPRSREASRNLGLALLRNGETDPAVAAFDRHLARFPDDAEVAFEQARILQWSRYAYRSKDAGRYLAMGLAVREDPARRRELARLLGRDRATLDAALAQYDRLLALSPGDRELRAERLKLLLWDPGRRGEAVRELERIEREGPANDRAERDLARLLVEEPGRAGEAAARYDALLAKDPFAPDLLLGRARALARAGRLPEAREAFARAVAVRPSPEARLEYAELLAADPSTADAAREQYESALRDSPRSRRARLGLARVLSARRETSRAAIAHYGEVLRSSPHDAEAHRGLARAYAWNGDPDRALAHGALAERYGRPVPDVVAIERNLRLGREPSLGGGVRLLSQPGSWGYSSRAVFATGRADPTPFTSSEVLAGFSSAAAEGARSSGAILDVRGEWRPDVVTRLRLGAGVDGVRPGGRALSGELRLERDSGGRTLSLAVFREARRDSFRAYAGEQVLGRAVGAASETAVEARSSWSSERGSAVAFARAGAVTGNGMAADGTAAIGGRADRVILRSGAWALSAGAAAEARHHARDLSGAGGDPAAPRLFSPPLFVQGSPRLSAVRDAGLAGRISVDAGPALQLTGGAGHGVLLGGDVRGALSHRLGDRLRITAEVRAERMADAYSRFEGALGAALIL